MICLPLKLWSVVNRWSQKYEWQSLTLYKACSSPELKVQVSFCDHLLSVVRASVLLSVRLSVCKLYPFSSSSPGPSFTKGRKYCRRRRRKRRLYVGIYVCVESVLLRAVSSVVNVKVNVNFRAAYDWSFSKEFN